MKKVKYKRMTAEEKILLFKLYEEKMELRKIARVLDRALSTVQYHFLCFSTLFEKKNSMNINVYMQNLQI